MMTGTDRPDLRSRTPPIPDAIIVAALMFLTMLFLYIFRPLEMSDNSIWYLIGVRDASASHLPFYPPHLLHMPIIFLIHALASKVSSCDVTCAGMLQSMIWATVSVGSVYVIARAVLGSAVGAVLTALTVLVAHGFWVFATQVEVYVPAVGCITAATALLFGSRSPVLSTSRLLGIAALWALATLYHLSNVLLFIPFAIFFYGAQGWGGWRQWATVSALAGTFVLTSFLAAYSWVWRIGRVPWSVEGFLSWVLEITDRPLTDWGSVSNWHPAELFRAGWSQVKTLTLFPKFLTIDLPMPLDQLPLGIIGAVIVSASLVWTALQIVRREAPVLPRVYFLALFATNFLFFAWWDPGVHKFFIPSSIPLIVLMAIGVRDIYVRTEGRWTRRLISGTVGAVIILMLAFNLPSVLDLKRSRGPLYAEAEIMNNLAPANCRIYAEGINLGPLRYFFGRNNNIFILKLEQEYFRDRTGQSLPGDRLAEGEDCAFIPIGFLSERRYERRLAKYLQTGTWKDYVAYVLDVEENPEGGGITHDAVELVADVEGRPNLLVDRRQRVAGRDIDELTGMIEAEVDRALQQFDGAPRKEEFEDTLLAAPSTQLEFGRDRYLIFGYGWVDYPRLVGQSRD